MHLKDIPVLVAHRGYASAFPENTLEGIEAAIAVGACGIEFDLQFSKDGLPVLLHDSDLKRVSGLDHSVFNLSLTELLKINAGEPGRLGAQFAHVRLVALEAFLEKMARYPQVRFFVEIKDESLAHHGFERILAQLEQGLAVSPVDYVLIAYNQPFLLQAGPQLDCPVGFILTHWDEENLALARELKPDYLICNFRKIPKNYDAFFTNEWEWMLYEMTDPVLALKYGRLGVGFIETMEIQEMLQHPELRRRSCIEPGTL